MTAKGTGPSSPTGDEDPPLLSSRIRRLLVGRPRDFRDRSIFHHLALVPFLAWVGLGADGLSSSAYGPEEAFRTLNQHTYLAVALAIMTAVTVLLISAAYSRIIEQFPHGGGGYVVATKLLGSRIGVVSGCALLVDYMLTITVSIAAAADALFSFIPLEFHIWKVPAALVVILLLTTLNIRGVRESVLVLTPIFILFLLTHLFVIAYGLVAHAGYLPETAADIGSGFKEGIATLGFGGMFLLFLHAYSMGGGTYTGIEAVSNGLPIMREPRVHTAKRTMIYMAISLALTAAGLLTCYLLWDVVYVHGKTMNAVLLEKIGEGLPFGGALVIVTLLSEGALLVVAAQAGFMDGPRVLANMAVDSWVPRRFGALSERLTTQNGVLLMSAASIAALVYTGGNVRTLVIMYSINVFLTFSISMFAMSRDWFQNRRQHEHWKRRFTLFAISLALCAAILAVNVYEKFFEGGWLTLAATGSIIGLCYLIRSHYRITSAKLEQLYKELGRIPAGPGAPIGRIDPSKPTAAVLVAGYGGLGIHTVLNIFRAFPDHFEGLIFISVGVIDSGGFKGEDTAEDLRHQTQAMLKKYLTLAHGLGIPAIYRMSLGTEAVEAAEKLCLEVSEEFPRTTFFAGKVIFERERWYQRLLHNETAFSIQKRLQWSGKTMVILPARLS